MRPIILAVALLFSICADAQDAESTAVAQSNVATRLFMDFCIQSAGDATKLTALADQYHLRRADSPFSEKVLQEKPGEVWSASNSRGDFVIISEPVNSCFVWARRADAATSIQHLKRIVTGAQRPGLQLKILADRDMPGQGGTYHYLAYLMAREGQATGVNFRR
jgi:hypothetical protein